MAEISPDVFVVCRFVRHIVELEDAKKVIKKTVGMATRRPGAVGMVVIAACGEQCIQMFTTQDSTSFACLPERIAERSNEISSYEMTVSVKLQVYDGCFDELPPDLKTVTTTNVIRQGRLLIPDTTRNDIYVTLESGKFPQAKNLECCFYPRLSDGKLLPNCMSIGSVEIGDGEYKSVAWANTATPTWRETVRLRIPPDVVPNVHLHFAVRQAVSKDKPSAPFAFGWFPLMGSNGSTLVANGDYSVDMYKPPSATYSTFYLDAKSQQPKKLETPLSLRKGENIVIKVLGFSKVPQDERIAAVLRWQPSGGDVASTIEPLSYADHEQTLRFLPGLLDTLFCMFEVVTPNLGDFPTTCAKAIKCYSALVAMIVLLVDERNKFFQSYRTVLENYIDHDFRSITAYAHLMMCVVYSIEKNVDVTQSLKALPYIFRFMVTSRYLYNRSQGVENNTTDTAFKTDVLRFLQLINSTIKTSSPHAIVARNLTARHYDVILQILGRFFTKAELCDLFVTFLGLIPYDEKNELFNKSKVQLIQRVLDTSLKLDNDTIPKLMPMLVVEMELQFSRCTSLLCEVIDVVFQQRANPVMHSVMWRIVLLLPKLVDAVQRNFELADEGKAEDQEKRDHQQLVTALLALLSVMSFLSLLTPENLTKIVVAAADAATAAAAQSAEAERKESTTPAPAAQKDKLSPEEQADVDMQKFLRSLFSVLWHCVSKSTYPQAWFFMDMFLRQTLVQLIYFFNNDLLPLRVRLLPSLEGEVDMWVMYFRLCLSLVENHFPLETSKFGPYTSLIHFETCFIDVPTYIIPATQATWEVVPNKEAFAPYLVCPVVSLLSKNSLFPTTDFVTRMYYTIAVAEFQHDGAFSHSEMRMCEAIDTLIRNGTCIPEAMKSFLCVNLQNCFQAEEPQLREKGSQLISRLSNLLQLLIDFLGLPQGQEYEEERTVGTLKMMAYFKRTAQDSFFRYVHTLYSELMRSGNNNTEAGMTLLLHASPLAWSNEKLEQFELMDKKKDDPFIMKFPAEKSAERKERICLQAVDCFEKGNSWEQAIDLLKEIVRVHLANRNYKKCAPLLKREATLFENIATVQRAPVMFFRVGYYGRGFPSHIQGKEFVYRGFGGEDLGAFTSRVRTKFPAAQLLDLPPAATSPTALPNPDQLYLLITTVDPASVDEQEGHLEGDAAASHLPTWLQQHRATNGVCIFRKFIRVRRVGGALTKAQSRDDPTEVTGVCSYFTTEDTFPTSHRSSVIAKRADVEMPPLQTALLSLIADARDLAQLHFAVSKEKTSISTLTVPVAEGIESFTAAVQAYQRSFFAQPQQPPSCVTLTKLLETMVYWFDQLVLRHRELCPPDMQHQHMRLEHLFSAMVSVLASKPETASAVKQPMVSVRPTAAAASTTPVAATNAGGIAPPPPPPFVQ
eukprot:TRINITY_DN10173_c0_g1_i1.p1 TRINITY_DN10173_c0_g1~~TRINITY_DN10173_c0_g1_i1.p1  ORF type:complete len:1565 (-),score=425.25 TRINITY_DN10173_c0_g1_i1:33-4265(-)